MAFQQRHLPDPVPPVCCSAGEDEWAAHHWLPLHEGDFYCSQCLNRLESDYVEEWRERVERSPRFGPGSSPALLATAELAAGALPLTPFERRLLVRLASEPDTVIEYSELAECVWGYEGGGDGHDRAALRQHVATLRRKLCALRVEINTVASVGYRFTFAGAGESAAD